MEGGEVLIRPVRKPPRAHKSGNRDVRKGGTIMSKSSKPKRVGDWHLEGENSSGDKKGM